MVMRRSGVMPVKFLVMVPVKGNAAGILEAF
jgi:hypothetical protein